MRRIVLINPPDAFSLDKIPEPPLGLLYIQSFAKENGHECFIHDCNTDGDNIDNIPVGDVYAFSTYSHSYKWCVETSRKLKARDKDSISVAGGYVVSALPKECGKDWDCIVIGEGEEGLLKVLGLEYEPIKTIDDLPFPIYTDEIMNNYSRRNEDGERQLSVLCSRGCPNRCNFCSICISRLYKPRSRSVENILKEIDTLVERGLHNVKFNDDNFLDVVEEPEVLCRALKERNIKYRMMTSSPSLTKENLLMLKETGCNHISVGIETMSERMLKLMNKNATVEDNINAIKNISEAGIYSRMFLLVGFPGETDESVDETINVLNDLDFDAFHINVFVPYPGTDVWNNPKKYNATINKNLDQYILFDKEEVGALVLHTNTFTEKDAKSWREKIKTEISKKHKFIK